MTPTVDTQPAAARPLCVEIDAAHHPMEQSAGKSAHPLANSHAVILTQDGPATMEKHAVEAQTVATVRHN